MKTQKGFAVLESLLILIIIATIAGTGWYTWHTKNQTDKILSEASNTAQTVKTNKTTNSSSTKAQNYLTIKEWGVKIPELSAGNTISYETNSSDENMADFVSSEQKALGGSCGTFAFTRYHVFRATSGYKATDEGFSAQLENAAKNNLAIQIDNYTYYILGDMTGGDCTGTAKEGSSISQQEVTTNERLLDSLKGIIKA